jgi:transcriptional regulator with XRE-family HTH domain
MVNDFEIPENTPNNNAGPCPAWVFSPGRLRGYRDRARLTRARLAHATETTAAAITGFETGTATPTAAVLATLAAAVGVPLARLTGPPGADTSREYWDVICAGMPPMTPEQIADVARVLRRIDAQRPPDERAS